MTSMVSCHSDTEELPSGADTSTGEPGFGIYLVDSGELVLSEQHIKAYYRNVHLTEAEEDTHAIELNEAGIAKWNSYMDYEGIPKLQDTLYKRDFAVRIEGKEIYRGKFYSMVSSSTYDGVVILDALIKLAEDNNRIYISYGYPASLYASSEDPRNSPEIIDFMDNKGLLK
ncbi:MAG: hypothetical protein JSW16_06505 [Dehalococcoidales bacterium]|nr:MAG: hypothetical protein JSW16_06505 [Dehalococcoidales bacterium]